MNHDEKVTVQRVLAAMPHLFSARHNRDYETLAIAYNESTGSKLTPVQVHEAMVYTPPAPAAVPKP